MNRTERLMDASAKSTRPLVDPLERKLAVHVDVSRSSRTQDPASEIRLVRAPPGRIGSSKWRSPLELVFDDGAVQSKAAADPGAVQAQEAGSVGAVGRAAQQQRGEHLRGDRALRRPVGPAEYVVTAAERRQVEPVTGAERVPERLLLFGPMRRSSVSRTPGSDHRASPGTDKARPSAITCDRLGT
jgi:hypothetical protein